MKIKAIFFDAGETLIYRNPSLVTIAHRCLKKYNFKIKKDLLAHSINKAALGMRKIVETGRVRDSKKWEIYINNLFKELNINKPELMLELRKRLRDGTSFRPFKDAVMVVDTLKKYGIKTGVISNASAQLEKILKRAGLFNRFDYIIISEKAGVEKPNKKIFRKALKESGLKACETVYIGDNYIADIIGAKKSGITPVWVKRKTKNAEFSFAGAVGEDDKILRISNLKEIIKLIKKEGWI